MKRYRITHGSFRQDDGSLLGPGKEIELPDDIAKQYEHQLVQLDGEAAAEARPANDHPAEA